MSPAVYTGAGPGDRGCSCCIIIISLFGFGFCSFVQMQRVSCFSFSPQHVQYSILSPLFQSKIAHNTYSTVCTVLLCEYKIVGFWWQWRVHELWCMHERATVVGRGNSGLTTTTFIISMFFHSTVLHFFEPGLTSTSTSTTSTSWPCVVVQVMTCREIKKNNNDVCVWIHYSLYYCYYSTVVQYSTSPVLVPYSSSKSHSSTVM
jgi:hypothetical protein